MELTEGRIIRDLPAHQLREIMRAAKFGEGGRLVYATCSLIWCKNEGAAAAFNVAPDFEWDWERRQFDGPGWKDGRRTSPAGDEGSWTVMLQRLHDCDGFFIAR